MTLQDVVEQAQAAFGAAACSIATLDEDEGALTYRAAAGVGADSIVGVRLPVTRGIAGWVAVSGQPLAVSDLAADRRFARDVAESTRFVPRTLLAAPITGPDGVIAVLSVLDRDAGRPDADHDLELAASFAAQAADLLARPESALPPELAARVRAATPEQRRLIRRLLDELP